MLVCVMPFCLAPCPPVRIDISILESRMYYWHDVDGPATDKWIAADNSVPLGGRAEGDCGV